MKKKTNKTYSRIYDSRRKNKLTRLFRKQYSRINMIQKIYSSGGIAVRACRTCFTLKLSCL
ncbi:hypothetical protein Hanom_Chr04g00381351 [Helianthus anomalus]